MPLSQGERPECAVCGAKMEDIGVYPHKPGEDAHRYKCTDCDRIIRRIHDTRFGDRLR
jgi:DNA-directed RNA polymerase subunit RPC12/RpoP